VSFVSTQNLPIKLLSISLLTAVRVGLGGVAQLTPSCVVAAESTDQGRDSGQSIQPGASADSARTLSGDPRTPTKAKLLLRLRKGTKIHLNGEYVGTIANCRQFVQLGPLSPSVYRLRLLGSSNREERFRIKLRNGLQIFHIETRQLQSVSRVPTDPSDQPLARACALSRCRAFAQAIWEGRLVPK